MGFRQSWEPGSYGYRHRRPFVTEPDARYSGECRPTSTYWDTAPGCHGNASGPDTCTSKRRASGTTGHVPATCASKRHGAGITGHVSEQWSFSVCLRVETQHGLRAHLPVLLQCNHTLVWRCPLLAWICNGDPTAQNDPLLSGLPQMWADDLYVMQPLQFVPMDQQVFATALVQASQPFVQQPATSASALGQQAQDADMMA